MRLCLLPVMAGLALFYLLPFLKVILFHFARDSFRKSLWVLPITQKCLAIRISGWH